MTQREHYALGGDTHRFATARSQCTQHCRWRPSNLPARRSRRNLPARDPHGKHAHTGWRLRAVDPDDLATAAAADVSSPRQDVSRETSTAYVCASPCLRRPSAGQALAHTEQLPRAECIATFE